MKIGSVAATTLLIFGLASCSGPTQQTAELQTPAQREYDAANKRMHAAMGAVPADPDEAFIQGMIPHHQGAIDMAKIVIKHGKDPETRKLAEAIIKAQETEIAQMKAWQQKRGTTQATPNAEHDHSKMEH